MKPVDFSKIRSKIARIKLSRSYKLGANLDIDNPHNSKYPSIFSKVKKVFSNQ